LASDPEPSPSDDVPEPQRVPVGIERAAAAACMALLVLITFANVVVRYLTDISFAFTEEYSVALMVIMTLFGTAVAFAADRHIRMTYLIDKLPAGPRRAAERAVTLLSLAMFALLVWYGGRMAWDDFRFEMTSPGLGLPQWIYTVWLPALGLVVCLRIAGRLRRVARTPR